MANKQLTAKVRLNTTQFESKLRTIARGIDALNKSVNKQSNAYNAVNSALGRTNTNINQAKNNTNQLANSANKVNNNFKKTNDTLGVLGTKLKSLAATYLGFQTMKLGITTSDSITSAKNRLNTLNGNDLELTEQSMDKIYAASQRARTSYSKMMAGASKSFTIANEAFQGNIDNAIRFEEIMAKSYTLAGASAEEQSNSMYQLRQALGSGILAGDELRSVREQAPLMYKEIEKYAQGVYDTKDSLKELASQGVITSDIVVAAVMGAGNKIDEQFKNTKMTFAQAWESIKNVSLQVFRKVSEKLEEMLNGERAEKVINGISRAIVVLGDVLYWVINLFVGFFNFCVDNWNWLKYVVCGALLVIMALLVQHAYVAISTAIATAWAWITAHSTLLLIVAGIMLILAAYDLWRKGTVDTCQAICIALLGVAVICFVIFGWVVALVVAAIALAIMWFDKVCYLVGFLAAVIVDIIALIIKIVAACVMFIYTLCKWVVAGSVNFAMGLYHSISAICSDIGIAFQNAWIWAKNTFWEFIADVLDGVSKLEPVINGIAKLLGKEGVDFGELSSNIRSKKSEYIEYKSVSDAWSKGWNTMEFDSMKDNVSDGWNVVGLANPLDWGSASMDWGQGVMESVNNWGSQFQTGNDKASANDKINGLLDPNDPAYSITGGFDPTAVNDDIAKGLSDLNGTADDIKKSVDVSKDDMDYLRKIADMEWRNEFTTAEIKVDMTNHNTVNGDNDLDGIVSYLSEVLQEEMTNVAYGVY